MLNKFRPSTKLPIILLAVIILLIFLHYFKILLPGENLIIKALSPIQNQVYIMGVKINNFYNTTRFRKDLVTTNLELEKKVKELTIQNAELRVLLAENQALQDQLNFLASSGLEAINAKVIGKNLQTNWQTLILDKGQKDGVQLGFPVIAQEGVIVGKVVEVGRNNCQILLINDSHSSLAATIQNQARTKGVVVGERGLSLKMELIPQDEEILVGDTVVTSGLEPNIPLGLVIGQVEQVIAEPNSFFQKAILQPLINFDDLIIVSILKNTSNE